MNRNLKTIIVSAILISTGIASGKVISPESAWKRLAGTANRSYSFKGCQPDFASTFSYEGKATLYLFNANGKTYCVSADDEVIPLLGYSDEIYSSSNLSPAFGSWLNGISYQIALVRAGAMPSENMVTRADYFSPIGPLCATKWNQDAPYNNTCPKLKGEEQRCYTGCVATAMAQVMKYHNWPLQGEGENSYIWNGITLRQNFEKALFDWLNMLDEYFPGEYTEEEGNAVAALMRSCGVSVEMSYSTSGSGALSQRIGEALGTYFKYDKSKLRYLMRDYYTLGEWEAMIYESLRSCGPVILDGQSNQGGHSFVCDGYDQGGYFHINWGWGGTSNGYYLLSVLDPFDQGIGGSGDNSGFDYMQDAITGIVPDKREEPTGVLFGQFYSLGEFGLDTSVSYAPGENVGPICEKGVFNFGPGSLPPDTELGLLFSNEETEEKYIEYGIMGETCRLMYGFSEIELPLPENIKDGIYRVTFSYRIPQDASDDSAVRNDGEGWIDVLFPVGVTASYTASVMDELITFEDSSWRPSSIGEMPVCSEPEADTRYYNLQGIEIKAPRKGEFLIMKNGKKIRKVIF